MRRFLLAAVLTFAACSSGHKKETKTLTTANATTVTTRPVPSASTAPESTTSRSTPATTGAPASTARIDDFRGPSEPQECNAPTSIDLSWTARGATRVDLRIDGGPVFARYQGGAQVQSAPLECDGKSHTYTLTAQAADGTRVTKSLTVATKPLGG
jgi:hypothetical protein